MMVLFERSVRRTQPSSYSIDCDTYPTPSGILWTDSHAMARIADPIFQLQINKTDGIESIVAESS